MEEKSLFCGRDRGALYVAYSLEPKVEDRPSLSARCISPARFKAHWCDTVLLNVTDILYTERQEGKTESKLKKRLKENVGYIGICHSQIGFAWSRNGGQQP